MWRLLRQVVNATNRKDLTALDPMNLYRRFCNQDGHKGLWGISLAKSTWYASLRREGFRIKKPHFGPLLSSDHIYHRIGYAELEIRAIESIKDYTRRLISMDSAKFSVKFNGSYGMDELNIVVDSKNPVEHHYGQLDRAVSHEAYGAVGWDDRTDLVFTHEQDPNKVSHPNASHVAEFVEKELAPMGVRIRKRLGLKPTDFLYVLLDGAGVHGANVLLDALHKHHFRVAGLAPKCPECQIIEVGWSMTKSALRRLEMPPKARKDPATFFKLVRKAWRSLSQRSLNNLMESYENRVRSLLAVNGRNFRFNGKVHEVVNEDDLVPVSDDEESDAEDE